MKQNRTIEELFARKSVRAFAEKPICAVLDLCNSAYAASIKTKRTKEGT